jgi:hypothetical protein
MKFSQTTEVTDANNAINPESMFKSIIDASLAISICA